MKFRNESKASEHLSFKDVEINQLFVCTDGHLWIKHGDDNSHRIALSNGLLSSHRGVFSPGIWIKEIKSEITGIEF